jgi:hypothetical protein
MPIKFFAPQDHNEDAENRKNSEKSNTSEIKSKAFHIAKTIVSNIDQQKEVLSNLTENISLGDVKKNMMIFADVIFTCRKYNIPVPCIQVAEQFVAASPDRWKPALIPLAKKTDSTGQLKSLALKVAFSQMIKKLRQSRIISLLTPDHALLNTQKALSSFLEGRLSILQPPVKGSSPDDVSPDMLSVKVFTRRKGLTLDYCPIYIDSWELFGGYTSPVIGKISAGKFIFRGRGKNGEMYAGDGVVWIPKLLEIKFNNI